MKTSTCKRLAWSIGALAVLAIIASGCDEAAIKANQQQVAMQQAQIDKMQKEIVALKAGQTPTYAVTTPSAAIPAGTVPSGAATAPGAPGTCDQTVLRTATRRGGDSYSSGDLKRALGYYRDAVAACPGDASAQVNLARTYEALGNDPDAMTHYRKAAEATGSSPEDQKAIQSAKMALSRLTASHH